MKLKKNCFVSVLFQFHFTCAALCALLKATLEVPTEKVRDASRLIVMIAVNKMH